MKGSLMKKMLAFLLTVTVLSVLSGDDNLLKNPYFTEKDSRGRIADWYSFTDASLQLQDGILKIKLDRPARKSGVSVGSVSQSVKSVKAGTYDFYGYYRGEINAIFVIARYSTADKKQVDAIGKWVISKNFIKAGDLPGWYKFFYECKIPSECEKLSIHIEAFGGEGKFVELKNIVFAESEE